MTTSDVAQQVQGWTADDSTFGARLALVRQRLGWGNVKEAAVACGLPPESWRSWERDGRIPRNLVEIAAVISERSGCDYGWLLAGRRLTTYAARMNGQDRMVTERYRGRPESTRPNGHPGHAHPNPATRRPARTSPVPAAMRADHPVHSTTASDKARTHARH